MTKLEYAKKRGIKNIIEQDNLDEEMDEDFKMFVDMVSRTTRRDYMNGKDRAEFKPKAKKRRR